MNRQLAMTLAITTAFAGFSTAATHAPVASTNAHLMTSTINPSRTANAVSAGDIHKTLVDLTSDALTPGNMDHLIRRFTRADQKQIESSSTYKENYGKSLDACVRRVRSDWKKTYGRDFNIRKAADFKPDFYSIAQSTAGANSQLAAQVTANSATGQRALRPNQGIAVMTLRAVGDRPELKAPFIEEDGRWRISIPNDETAAALRQNLLDHLSAFCGNSAHWPKDENAAYRMVARHVLLAVLNQPVMHPLHAGR
jgi:hypothetical protein